MDRNHKRFSGIQSIRFDKTREKIDVDIPIKRAISIIGPRRTGKTYFMYQLISNLIGSGIDKSRPLYINLERTFSYL